MRRWSEVAERVAATTRTSEKTALLAEYLRSLPAKPVYARMRWERQQEPASARA